MCIFKTKKSENVQGRNPNISSVIRSTIRVTDSTHSPSSQALVLSITFPSLSGTHIHLPKSFPS